MKTDQYDPISEFQITQRRLPHWQSPGSVYFVTTRTQDNRQFTDPDRDIIFQTVKYHAGTKYDLYAVVVMPDHLHLLIKPLAKTIEGSIIAYFNLTEIMHSIKSFSAQKIKGKVWQHESYDHLIRNDRDFSETM